MSTKPNSAAVALGKLRWSGVSAEDRTAQMTRLAKARAKKLSPAKRLAIAKKASKAAAAARKQRAVENKSTGA